MFVGTGLHWYGLVKQSQALLASNLARDSQVRTGECPEWPRWRWLPVGEKKGTGGGEKGRKRGQVHISRNVSRE